MFRPLVPLTMLLLIVSTSVAHGGAWTREQGGWFLKLGYDRWHTGERYDEDGRRVAFEAPEPGLTDPSAYRSDVFRAYAEYGLADGLTGALAASFDRVEIEGRNVVRSSTGPGDIALTLRQRLVTAPFPVSAELLARLPTGDAEGPGPALGSGHADFGVGLQFGASNALAYVTGGGGYTFRGGAQANELPWNIEAGYRIVNQVSLRLDLRGAMTPGKAGPGTATFDPALSESSHVTGGVGVVLHGNPLDFVFTTEHVLDGTRTLAGTRFTFSVWAQR